MISQVQCGDEVKKVSDIRLLPVGHALIHPPLPQAHDSEQSEHYRARGREERGGQHIPGGYLGGAGEAVHFRLVHQKIERIEPSQELVVGAVQVGSPLAQLVQLLHARLGLLLELPDRAEPNRVGGAGLGAGRLHAGLEPVVAERALLSRVRGWIDVDHAEGTRGDAEPAAVAHVRLDHHGIELGADDGAGGTDLETACLSAVLADVAHHEPAALAPVLAELLDELDVAPVHPVQSSGVVVAVAAHLVPAAAGRRQLVPLLAGDLAGLASDTYRGVGIEPHRLGHHAFSTLQRNALPSWMLTLGSPTSAVSVFTTSPVTTPSQPQCHGMPTWWITLFPNRKGRTRRVTRALARISARGVRTRTQSVFRIPFSAASSGESSMKSSGMSSVSHGFQRLMAPAR